MAGEEKADKGQIDYLKAQIKQEIGSCDGSAWFNTMKAFRLKISGIIFGSATTVPIGVSHSGVLEGYSSYLSVVALLTSAIVSGLTAWEAFFSYRERWGNFTEAAQKLRRLAGELDYGSAAASGVSQVQLDGFFKRYQAILQDAHTGWLGKKEASHR